jgi:hypothetical protein
VIPWGESAYADERYICTQVLFGQLFPGASKSLISMADRLVLDRSERDDRHGRTRPMDTPKTALADWAQSPGAQYIRNEVPYSSALRYLRAISKSMIFRSSIRSTAVGGGNLKLPEGRSAPMWTS